MTLTIQDRVDADIKAVSRVRQIKKLQKDYSEFIAKADIEQNEIESDRYRKLAEVVLGKIDALGGKPLQIEEV